MSERENKEFVILFIVMLLFLSILPEFAKLSFVHSTGNIKLIGPYMGALISTAIFLRWKYARTLFYIVFLLVIPFDLLGIFAAANIFKWNFAFLTLCHAVLLIIFSFSKNMETYLNKSKIREGK